MEEREDPGFKAPPRWGHTPEDVCPGFLIQLPQVREAAEAHRWWDKGQLVGRTEITPLLVDCIDILDSAIGEVEADMVMGK